VCIYGLGEGGHVRSVLPIHGWRRRRKGREKDRENSFKK